MLEEDTALGIVPFDDGSKAAAREEPSTNIPPADAAKY